MNCSYTYNIACRHYEVKFALVEKDETYRYRIKLLIIHYLYKVIKYS